ncbi:hypothetical protein ABI59_11250 [Acidobacteria bacterium Mor1]|nr:hypothetical protein ABI59_11250 [Acidobacteria bacterium Mor1]
MAQIADPRVAAVLRSMHDITIMESQEPRSRTEAMLALGCAQFGLPIGILAQVEDESYEVVEVHSPPEVELARGDSFALGATYCQKTIAADGPVGFEHAAQTEWNLHPAYVNFRLEAYFGIAIRVFGQTWGTLNFSSLSPRDVNFGDVDREIIRLMAECIGSTLERDTLEREVGNSGNGVMRRITAGIAHDMNDMLTAILGHATLAGMDRGLSADTRHNLERILHSAQRAGALCGRLGLHSGHRGAAIEPLDLSAVTRDTLHLRQVTAHGITQVHTDLAEQLPMVEADYQRLQQALMAVLECVRGKEDGIATLHVSTRAVEVYGADLGSSLQRDEPPHSPGPYLVCRIRRTPAARPSTASAALHRPIDRHARELAAARRLLRPSGGWIRLADPPEAMVEVLLPLMPPPVAEA